MKKAYKNPLLRIRDTLLDEKISVDQLVSTSVNFQWPEEDLEEDDSW